MPALTPTTTTTTAAAMLDQVWAKCDDNLSPALPLLFNIEGKPYRLDDYFPFRAVHRRVRARRLMLLAGRQVSKSQNLGASQISLALARPFTTVLTLHPFSTMSRRFSRNVVRPLLVNSPVAPLLRDPTDPSHRSVTQRSLGNGSELLFSYAADDATRVRGIAADALMYDEIQDVDLDTAVPVAVHTMDASSLHYELYAGTPRTTSNAAAALFEQTTQSEWVVPCLACDKWNVPSLEHDLLGMIGPWDDKIGPDRPATVCARCRRRIDPRDGHWVHAFPDRATAFEGFHIPQILLPMHYANPVKWLDIWNAKLRADAGRGVSVFYNEVLGVPYDTGSQLVTLGDLRAAASLDWDVDLRGPDGAAQTPGALAARWTASALGVDWGGGGAERTSLTKFAVAGLRPGGEVEIAWGQALLNPHDHHAEARAVVDTMNRWPGLHLLAHDVAGAGAVRETILHHAGFEAQNVMPIAYVGRLSGVSPLRLTPATPAGDPACWRLDKARAIQLVCHLIRERRIRFFCSDPGDEAGWGLIADFLGIFDEKTGGSAGREFYVVRREPGRSDDFVHAVTFACVALWNSLDAWPDLGGAVTPLRPESQVLDDLPDVTTSTDHYNPWTE